MAFEQITNLKSYKKINAGVSIQTTQAKIMIENIKSILSANSTANVIRYEYEGEKLNAIAQEKITIVYIDNENSVKSVEKPNEFSFSVSTQGAGQFFIDLAERETTVEQISNGELVATSVFVAQAYATLSNDFCAIRPKNEGVFEKTKIIQTQNITATCQDKFAVSFEGEITASSILSSEAKCFISSITATEDAVVVDGELFVSILSEIDGNIKQKNKKIEFSGEAVALGLKKDNIVDASALVENLVVTLSDAGANATITMNATVEVVAECYGDSAVEVVEDAFMEDKELIVSSQGVEISKISQSKYSIEEKETTLQAKDKSINMGTILAVINPKIENGTLSCTVIYRQAETDEIASSIMFSSEKEFTETSCVAITSFSKRRTKEVLIEYVSINKSIEGNSTYEVFASNVEVGGEVEASNKGIVVYAAKKGQTLFDVAKVLKANPNTLKSQNSNLDDELQQDRKILLYKTAKISVN